MSEPTLKLPGNADQLLQSFPAGEPDFEAQARAIQARIAAQSERAALDDLLRVPDLPGEAGEPAASSQVRAAPAPKSSFAEMARKSLQKKDDSAEFAKDLLAATAQSRRPNAEMVERVRAASRLAPSAGATGTPVPSSSRDVAAAELGADEAPRASGVISRLPNATATPAPRAARLDRGTIIGITGGMLAVAACVALFLDSREASDPTSAALAAEKATQLPAAAPQLVPATPQAPAKKEDGVVSPEALAAAPEATPADASKTPTKPGTPASGATVAAASKATVASSAPSTFVLDDDAAPPSSAVAEQKAEPLAPEPKLEPAEGKSGDVPLTPSAGAVSTAFGSVRSGAQACLAGQTDPVTAAVTFASDGHVLRVAAGGTAGSCIQAALMKARIAPFARDSFTATIVVRPP